MILKRIALENIRSYKNPPPIELPIGRTLFEGDIGSGKSTILSAIEFALFGLGDIDGEYLLRSDARKGSVLLDFEVDGKSYQAYRSLARGRKNVNQADGYIVENDTRTDYGVNEMKSRILEIIGINERPQAKTTSLIYRFAIFTPQEMMKQVLEVTEKRLETLRRAFGIEEYSVAKRNTDAVNSWIRQEGRIAERITADLPQKKDEFNKQETAIMELKDEMNSLKDKIGKVDGELAPLEEKYPSMKKKKDLVVGLAQSIPLLEKSSKQIQRSLKDEGNRLVEFDGEFQELKKAESLASKLEPEYQKFRSKKSQLEKLEQSVKRYEKLEKEKAKFEKIVERSKGQLESRIKDLNDSIEESETGIEKGKQSLTSLPNLRLRVGKLEESIKKLSSLRKEQQRLSNEVSKLEANKESKEDSIKDQYKEIVGIVEIGVGARCPKCKQELTEEHITKLKEEFQETKHSAKLKIEEMTQAIHSLDSKIGKLDEEVEALETEETELTGLKKKFVILEAKEESLKDESAKVVKRNKEFEELTRQLKEEDYALTEKKQLSEMTTEMNALEVDRTAFDSLREQVKQYEDTENESLYIGLIQKVKRLPDVERKIERTKEEIEEIKTSADATEGDLKKQRLLYSENVNVLQEIETLDNQIERIKSERGRLKEALSGKKSAFESAKSRRDELETEIKGKEELLQQKQLFYQTELWLDQCFTPSVDDIEKHVLASINDEFNQMFQQWFNALIETGDISVEADENFTPIVTQNGYKLPVDNLSGGEKTSVALAYRLALNVLVRRTASLKSELLILDEPTDGFSSEQLIKLRQVLDTLEATQVIMVSHERELESFVDNICRVTKEAGVSKVELLASR